MNPAFFKTLTLRFVSLATAPTGKVRCMLVVAMLVSGETTAQAQVFNSGPSDSSLFATVVNLPPDPNILSHKAVGGSTQLNVTSGGSVGNWFESNSGSEVNLSGGSLGNWFEAYSGSEVNISGGSVGSWFEAHSGSEINISGGNFGSFFDAYSGSEVNISGGTFPSSITIRSGAKVNVSGGSVLGRILSYTDSEVTISGGNFGPRFFAYNSDLELIGGEFRLNGQNISGTSFTLSSGDTFSSTLSDGSVFILDSGADTFVGAVRLTSTSLPTYGTTPIVLNGSVGAPTGLRAGQSLTLQAGGELGNNFAAVDSAINIDGGTTSRGLEVTDTVVEITGGEVGTGLSVLSGSTVNVQGGRIRRGFNAYADSEINITSGNIEGVKSNAGSVVNITGGDLAIFEAGFESEVNVRGGRWNEKFSANSGSEVNLFGSAFLLDGEPIIGLIPDETFSVTSRDVTLSGLLADGSPFSFDLNSSQPFTTVDYFNSAAKLNVILVSVPEPTSTILSTLVSIAWYCQRKRRRECD